MSGVTSGVTGGVQDISGGAPAAPEIYRSLFAAYPDALLLVDPEGLIVLANPQASRLLGYSEQELVGLGVDALVPDAIRPRHAAYRNGYAERPRARPMGTQMELVARRRDGSDVMVEIALSPLHDQGLPYVVAAVRGIDSYPRVQQALRRARYSACLAQLARLAVDEPDLEVMLQRVPAAVAEAVQADSVALLLLESGGSEFRVVGGAHLLPDEAMGMRFPNESDSLAGYAAGQGCAVNVPDFAAETRFAERQRPHEHGLRSGLATPLVDRGQVMGVLTLYAHRPQAFAADEMQLVESIASLLDNRLQRARSEKALQHVQRLETVGQLTGGVAHDFNNLLTVIQGNLQVLEERPALLVDETAAECVAAAMRASQRGANLTQQLLTFSRRQALSPRMVDVPALLHELASMLRRTLDRGIAVQVAVEPLHCLADPAQLESALLNLAVNARDAMPSGGLLRLSCRPLHVLSNDLATELEPDPAGDCRYAAIEVSDNGAGMPASVLARAFEPFFTTKDLGRGTGLGLSTVFGFAKQSLGTARLRSVVGQGTTVTLVLPSVSTSPTEHADRAGTTTVDTALPVGTRVLLVEDQPEVRRTIAVTLGELGCRVTEVDSAEHALALLGGLGTYELLLSDVALGAGQRGTELARVARLRWPAMGRLLMSGYAGDIGQQASSADADELLAKPFDRSTLLAALWRALAAASLISEAPPPVAR